MPVHSRECQNKKTLTLQSRKILLCQALDQVIVTSMSLTDLPHQSLFRTSCTPQTSTINQPNHLQKFSDNSAIVRTTEPTEKDFVNWCQQIHLQLNAGKTKEMLVDFHRHRRPCTQVNTQGTDIEMTTSYKYLGVHMNNKLDWTDHTAATYKKGQNRLHLLRKLRSFEGRGHS